VTKLLFAKCALTSTEAAQPDSPGTIRVIDCTIAGVTASDQVIATFNNGANCFGVTKAVSLSGEVDVYITNHCTVADAPGTGAFISLVVFKK
jgi:hypothetical protein